jgi:mRNA interferase MazF
VICEAWDVVVVPFPFTDRAAQKKRPSVVLSRSSFNRRGFTVMAMITTAETGWPGDTPIVELKSAGLHTPCIVRLKLFTLDNRLVLRRAGRLGAADQSKVLKEFKALLV